MKWLCGTNGEASSSRLENYILKTKSRRSKSTGFAACKQGAGFFSIQLQGFDQFFLRRKLDFTPHPVHPA
jgi:hypothetical protein